MEHVSRWSTVVACTVINTAVQVCVDIFSERHRAAR